MGHDKATLIMHTDVNDVHGQPLEFLAQELGITNGQIIFSTNKIEPQHLAVYDNLADVTLNISDAEGFGFGFGKDKYKKGDVMSCMDKTFDKILKGIIGLS